MKKIEQSLTQNINEDVRILLRNFYTEIVIDLKKEGLRNNNYVSVYYLKKLLRERMGI